MTGAVKSSQAFWDVMVKVLSRLPAAYTLIRRDLYYLIFRGKPRPL